jgi:hypothetical protein
MVVPIYTPNSIQEFPFSIAHQYLFSSFSLITAILEGKSWYFIVALFALPDY